MESLRKQVFHYHSKGVSQKDLARDLRLGKSTVERWYHYGYEIRHKKILNCSCPRILGLDEHSFNRKIGYATTFCDLAKHKILDVVEGRSAKDLEGYLSTLEGREKVLVVCIDLSSSYRSLIKRYFPNAKIVADMVPCDSFIEPDVSTDLSTDRSSNETSTRPISSIKN